MPGIINCPYCRKNITNCSVQLTPLEEMFKEGDVVDTYRCLKTGESYRVNRKTREVVKVT